MINLIPIAIACGLLGYLVGYMSREKQISQAESLIGDLIIFIDAVRAFGNKKQEDFLARTNKKLDYYRKAWKE